jgi:hypothetical protein
VAVVGGVGLGQRLGESRELRPGQAPVENDPVEDALNPVAVALAPHRPVPAGLESFVDIGGHGAFFPVKRVGPPSAPVEGRIRRT